MPTHDEAAADAVDASTSALVGRRSTFRLGRVMRAFWWLVHHAVARPLVLMVPVQRVSRFSAWTAVMFRR